MTKFEYKFAPPAKDGDKEVLDFIGLQKLGQEGWELISIANNGYMVLKKPVSLIQTI